MSWQMLLDPGKLAAALPTDVQEQVALLEGVLSHAEEGNPARHQFIAEIAISAKWFLHIIHVILAFFPLKRNHVLICQKLQFFQKPHYHLKVWSIFIWRSHTACA